MEIVSFIYFLLLITDRKGVRLRRYLSLILSIVSNLKRKIPRHLPETIMIPPCHLFLIIRCWQFMACMRLCRRQIFGKLYRKNNQGLRMLLLYCILVQVWGRRWTGLTDFQSWERLISKYCFATIIMSHCYTLILMNAQRSARKSCSFLIRRLLMHRVTSRILTLFVPSPTKNFSTQ